MVQAGILTSATGPRGGFRLARGPRTITLLDVVTATEGASGSLPLPGGPQEGAGRPRPPAPTAEPDGGGNDSTHPHLWTITRGGVWRSPAHHASPPCAGVAVDQPQPRSEPAAG
ncbi:Rrf2 family transcriptional regulator [Streptomyces sp. NPDC102282]|uniref:Rrf2 family transcriptional regulator n=1 Tax=Streptomyces sp. NPDC102282 TaxID=3366154 RepID=UPI00380A3DA4